MEKRLPLGGGVTIWVNEVHRFGTDAVLLADFASPRPGEAACDLGTGCGILPLLWCRGAAPATVTALDIQPDAIALLTRSVAENGLEDRVTPLLADLRQEPATLRGKFRLVTMNPPYQTAQSGAPSPCEGRSLARHEVTCTLSDAADSATRLLQTGGRFCLCLRPERLADAMEAMRRADLEPKRLRLVVPRPGAAPHLFLLEGQKGARPGGLRIEPIFSLTDAAGADSPEMAAVCREYRQAREENA